MFVEGQVLAWVRPNDNRMPRIVDGDLFDQHDEISKIVNVPVPFGVPHVRDACLAPAPRAKAWGSSYGEMDRLSLASGSPFRTACTSICMARTWLASLRFFAG